MCYYIYIRISVYVHVYLQKTYSIVGYYGIFHLSSSSYFCFAKTAQVINCCEYGKQSVLAIVSRKWLKSHFKYDRRRRRDLRPTLPRFWHKLQIWCIHSIKMQNFRIVKNDGNAVWERITITKTLSELRPLAEELGR